MQNDIFSKIVRGEIPCHKIYEDDSYLAFLDIKPVTDGHTLLLPKKYAKYVWDVEDIGELFEICKKIANHFREVTGNEITFGLIHGEGVPYAHVHIIPREGADEFARAVSAASKELDSSRIDDILKKFKI